MSPNVARPVQESLKVLFKSLWESSDAGAPTTSGKTHHTHSYRRFNFDSPPTLLVQSMTLLSNGVRRD